MEAENHYIPFNTNPIPNSTSPPFPMQRFVPVSQKNNFAKFCANLGCRISISKLLRQKKEKTMGKDRIFLSCPRYVFRCGYHVFFSKILFVMLWILTHLSWLEFQTQYRGYDPSSLMAGQHAASVGNIT